MARNRSADYKRPLRLSRPLKITLIVVGSVLVAGAISLAIAQMCGYTMADIGTAIANYFTGLWAKVVAAFTV